MKAVRIHSYGNDAPEPIVRADDVLIRVIGTSVNPVDWKIREGHLKEMIS
jgi:NADPH:quinone reductase-like Zn-dependent oxidoreductase